MGKSGTSRDAGVAVADHCRRRRDLDAAVAGGERFGYPFMLKARRGAYDGKGNAVVVSRADVEAAARVARRVRDAATSTRRSGRPS